jgi:NitT/TauT family transport system substrate-binding protein
MRYALRDNVRRGIRAPLLLLVAVSLLAAACSSDKGGSSGSGSSGGLETSSITIGSLPVVDAAPAYIADKAGYFKQEGLTVKFQQAQGGAALVPALVSGGIQVAFSNWVSLFLAKSNGIDLTVIADGDKAKPGFSGVFVMPNSPIKTPADLAGKKIAVNTLNNIGGLVISAVLKQQGVDPKSVKFVEVGFPDMGATLQRGDVDAVWVVEPFTSAVKGTLNARLIFDPFSGPTAALPVGGYAVTKKFADENPKTVAAFARAIDKAVTDANADRTKVNEVVPTYIKIDAATASKVTLPIYAATPNPIELQRVADLMQQFGIVSQRLDVASFTRTG